jgi:hypothetical protein
MICERLDEPERARGLVARWLAPGGEVYAFYDAPS